MSLLMKASRERQTIARVTPDSAGWKHVGFAAYRLNAGDVVHVYDADRESCIVVLTGTVSVEAGDEHYQSIGSRDSVFEDAAPYAVYVPPKLAAIVRAERDAEIGVASAPAKGEYPPRLIEPSQMKR